MESAPPTRDERERLADLRSYEILDTLPEPDFDDLTRIAAQICGTPISLVSLVDGHRQWFKSRHGLEASETSREVAFCAHAILQGDLFVVEDAFADDRFRDNPLAVGEPHVRFYAGAPLRTPAGHNVGTLCVIDHEPRALSVTQREALGALARQVVSRMELRKRIAELELARKERDEAEEVLRNGTEPLTPVASGVAPPFQTTRRLAEIALPLTTFFVLLLITSWMTALSTREQHTTRTSRFVEDTRLVRERVERRMQDYEELLQSCVALFSASRVVSADEWRRFVGSLRINERYPGVLGTGFAVPVQPADVGSFVQQTRNTVHPDFTLTPAGERRDYFPILYLEPIARNRAAIGFDIGSEMQRREAVERARDTGATSVTGRIILVQDHEHLPGFLMLVPVYRTGAVLDTVEQRREALTGWVYVASRVKDLLTQVPDARMDEVAFTVWDGTPSEHSLLFEGGSPDTTLAAREDLRSEKKLSLYGRRWTIRVEPTAVFRERTSSPGRLAIPLGGLLISVLLSAFLWSILATRRRALVLADEMTSAIKRSQRHVRALSDNLTDAIVTIADSGSIISANRAAESLFERRPSGLIGVPVSELLPGVRVDSPGGIQIIREAGGTRAFEVVASDMGADADRFTILVARDVTSRERLAQERELVRAASVAVAESPSFDSALRGLLEHLSGLGHWMFAESWLPDGSRARLNRGPVWLPEDSTGAMARFAASSEGLSLAVGEGLPGVCFERAEVVMLTEAANDARFFHRREVAAAAGLSAAAAVPVFDERGEIVTVLVFFAPSFHESVARDLMILSAACLQLGSLLQRKRWQDELSDSEKRYRDLFEGASDLIQSVSPDGRILYANPAWLHTLGYEQADLENLSLWDVIAPESREHCERVFRVEPGTDIGKVEAVFCTKEGERRILEGNVSCSFEGDHLVSTRGIFRDVTERHAVEKLKKEFVSTVSHELRTPLTSIRGSLDLLSGEVFGPLSDGAAEVVAIAHRNCTRLIELINDILDLERLDSGRMEIFPEPVEVGELFREAEEAVRSFARQNGIRMRIDPSHSRVTVDRKRMAQVLVNLLSNAIKFSEPDSEVRLLSLTEDGRVTLVVEDDGKGIPGEFLSCIFDRFQQVESTDSRSRGGSGLGLAICRSIVGLHGGEIGVGSTVGVGSRFWIQLELSRPESGSSL